METETASGPKRAIRQLKVDALELRIYAQTDDLMHEAAIIATEQLRAAIAQTGKAAAILATGNTQLLFLEKLAVQRGLDWSCVTLFHMDEYLGIGGSHPSSFQTYMREKVAARVRPGTFHYIAGDALEPIEECLRYGRLLRAQPIDLCVLGVGDNGHIAFNDPAVANFEDNYAVKLVRLDEVSRFQQARQGHFRSREEVPLYALTLTIPALCSAKRLVCLATGRHKAAIISKMLREPVGSVCPASVLRHQPDALLLLDEEAASLI